MVVLLVVFFSELLVTVFFVLGPNYHIETQGLRINSAQRDDTGRYHCTADNRVATTMFSSSVRVEGMLRYLLTCISIPLSLSLQELHKLPISHQL